MVSQVPANPLVRRKVVKKVTKKFKKPQWDLRPSVPVSAPSRCNAARRRPPSGGACRFSWLWHSCAPCAVRYHTFNAFMPGA